MTLKQQEIILNQERKVRLSVMIQAVGGGAFPELHKRPGVLILPGGGYSMCSNREAEMVAYPYLQAGYHAFVLRYSVGKHNAWPNPLNDYEQAMELIYSHAEEWNVLTEKMALIGFSAGGHLAACAATMSKYRPQAAILGYAALSRESADMCQPGMPVPGEHVDEKTCPMFLFATRDDNIIPVQDTVDFEKALIGYGIMFESHIYAFGQHGFSTGVEHLNAGSLCSRTKHWVSDSIEWLQDVLGVLQTNGMAQPVCLGKINGDWEEMLSVDCTVGHLKKQGGQAQQVVRETLFVLDAAAAEMTGNNTIIETVYGKMKLRDLMVMTGQPQADIVRLDEDLKKIVNSRDSKAIEKQQRDLKIAEDLGKIRNSRVNGDKTYSVDELDAFLADAIK